jgi:hypothetical protein
LFPDLKKIKTFRKLSVFALEICRVVSNLHEQRGQETDSDSGRDIDPTLIVSKLREPCRSYYWLKQQKSLLKWLTIIKPND